jgi:hypothetical protein
MSANMNRTSYWIASPAALAVFVATSHSAEPLWRQIMPREKVEADANGDYSLAESNGPWMIMAASFEGDSGEQQARDLVLELRGKFNLPAYYYGMTFKIGDERPGRGLDDYGAPIKRRYQRGNQVLEHAVLVGEFPTIDDLDAQHLLERIKTIQPDVLRIEAGEATSQSLVAVRQFHNRLKQQLGKPVPHGPMGHAFITKNPLLPKEYFTPKGVDAEVAKWNDDIEHSLLRCPGKYTIKVATFSGRTSLQKANDDNADDIGVRQARVDDPLVVAVKNAHLLTEALRSRGWEAYEFHDRYESYVTVGSFDEMQRLPDGRLAPATHDARVIIDTFGAATPNVGFERPAYNELGVKQDEIAKVERNQEQIKNTFKTHFSATYGEISEGFFPKRFVGLPFDIQPCPIEAPKKSVSAAYVRN